MPPSNTAVGGRGIGTEFKPVFAASRFQAVADYAGSAVAVLRSGSISRMRAHVARCIGDDAAAGRLPGEDCVPAVPAQ